MSDNSVVIDVYETNLGTYFSFQKTSGWYSNFDSFLVNGTSVNLLKAESANWYVIQGDIESVSKTVRGKAEIVCYALFNKALLSENIPDKISVEYKQINEDDHLLFVPPYCGLDSIYNAEYVQLPDEIVDVNFTINCKGVLTISDNTDYTKRNIRVKQDTCVEPPDISKVCTYDDFVLMCTPEFLLNQAPCNLSSKQVYDITRQFVKQNIDLTTAVITSDYDFCFTVKKKVPSKPYTVSHFSMGKRGKIKESIAEKTYKEVEIFAMSWDKAGKTKPYGNYKDIGYISGANLKEVQYQLERFLQELISVINQKVTECSCCDGAGHIVEKWS